MQCYIKQDMYSNSTWWCSIPRKSCSFSVSAHIGGNLSTDDYISYEFISLDAIHKFLAQHLPLMQYILLHRHISLSTFLKEHSSPLTITGTTVRKRKE